MNAIAYPHIEIKDGIPTIDGTRLKVVHLVLEQMAHDWTPQESQRQHPSLTLAQIHSALAYYHDHQEEMDKDIAERLRDEAELAEAFQTSPLRAKLLRAKYGQNP
jgi:uncharacterized protein (DUF433 family)